MAFYRGSRPALPRPRCRMGRLFVVASLVLFAYLLAAGNSGLYQLYERQREIESVRDDLAALEVRNTGLREEARLLESDLGMIERIAREHYGMVKAHESVYMVYPHERSERR